MAAIASPAGSAAVDDATYKRQVRAWIFYDWANSAFVTTVLAAFLPNYFSLVAGATLPSRATATAYFSLTLSVALFISAIISPILGTISDVARGKKRLLAVFTTIGVIASSLLVLVGTGDWILASILAVIGRIGLNGALVFYDALLPHVAKPEEQDRISAQGYAFGYLGGGILLLVNVIMYFVMGNDGVRLSFLSVGIWWALFALPLFRYVPEPESATEKLQPGETVLGVSIKRLRETFKHLRQYRQLFLYLIAYLIYNDGIGTIITQATIYGTELGFGTVELVLALLLVQFVGIPFSLVFGRLPDKNEKRRPLMTAFIVINAIALPIIGILLSRVLPTTITGQPPAPYVTTATHSGENEDGYLVTNAALVREGTWAEQTIEGKTLIGEGVFAQLAAVLTGTPDDATYAITTAPGDAIAFNLNGQELELTYAVGPNNGIIGIEVDGERLVEPTDEDAGVPQYVTIDTYNPTLRYGDNETITLDAPGQYAIRLVNLDEKNADSTGNDMAIAHLDVLPPIRLNSLPTIFGLLIGVEVVLFGVAFAVKQFFVGLAESLDTRRSILLSLVIYSIIATWGFFLNSTIEFWFLAWMVAIVQGGSQALSRSLYAQLTPKSKSGEFFGLFSIMEKFSSIIGPLLFAFAALTLGSSRPAILSLIVLFVIGGYLLTRVNISEGQQSAREEDAEILHST